MTIFLVLVAANLAAMIGAPALVLHLSGSVTWALVAASVPWLTNGYIVGGYWAIRRGQKKGRTGAEMGAPPFLWTFMFTPAAVAWGTLAVVIAMLAT